MRSESYSNRGREWNGGRNPTLTMIRLSQGSGETENLSMMYIRLALTAQLEHIVTSMQRQKHGQLLSPQSPACMQHTLSSFRGQMGRVVQKHGQIFHYRLTSSIRQLTLALNLLSPNTTARKQFFRNNPNSRKTSYHRKRIFAPFLRRKTAQQSFSRKIPCMD